MLSGKIGILFPLPWDQGTFLGVWPALKFQTEGAGCQRQMGARLTTITTICINMQDEGLSKESVPYSRTKEKMSCLKCAATILVN